MYVFFYETRDIFFRFMFFLIVTAWRFKTNYVEFCVHLKKKPNLIFFLIIFVVLPIILGCCFPINIGFLALMNFHDEVSIHIPCHFRKRR